jgi:hypothetical protein
MSLMTDSVNFLARSEEYSFMPPSLPVASVDFLQDRMKMLRTDYMGQKRAAVNIKFAVEMVGETFYFYPAKGD